VQGTRAARHTAVRLARALVKWRRGVVAAAYASWRAELRARRTWRLLRSRVGQRCVSMVFVGWRTRLLEGKTEEEEEARRRALLSRAVLRLNGSRLGVCVHVWRREVREALLERERLHERERAQRAREILDGEAAVGEEIERVLVEADRAAEAAEAACAKAAEAQQHARRGAQRDGARIKSLTARLSLTHMPRGDGDACAQTQAALRQVLLAPAPLLPCLPLAPRLAGVARRPALVVARLVPPRRVTLVCAAVAPWGGGAARVAQVRELEQAHSAVLARCERAEDTLSHTLKSLAAEREALRLRDKQVDGLRHAQLDHEQVSISCSLPPPLSLARARALSQASTHTHAIPRARQASAKLAQALALKDDELSRGRERELHLRCEAGMHHACARQPARGRALAAWLVHRGCPAAAPLLARFGGERGGEVMDRCIV